jgi:hypothetical protein
MSHDGHGGPCFGPFLGNIGEMKTIGQLKLTTGCLFFATALFSTTTLLLAQEVPFSSEPPLVSPQSPQIGETQLLPTPAQQQSEEIDILTKAPLHEAFAEVPNSNPGPNPLILRKPPAAIEELPPEYRPEGENVQWIPGYWFWDDDREDFIWISGIWRDAPPGQRWVPGYWDEITEGFRWVNGFWIANTTEEVSYLPAPPASLEIGPSYAAPGDDYMYTPGCWVYQSSRYIWQPGYYQPRIANYVWIPPTYVWTPAGYVYRPGFWDLGFENRGVAFAPVYFNQPVYLTSGYRYTPSCVINTGYNLLPYLFVRRNFNHYYFGDWYGAGYANRGYCGWSQLAFNTGFRGYYDPLYTYYNSNRFSYNNVNLMIWVGSQYRNCSQNLAYRPNSTFNRNFVPQGNNLSGNRQPSPGKVHIAQLYSQRVNESNQQAASRNQFRKLDDLDRVNLQTSGKTIHSVATERKSLERTLKPQVPDLSKGFTTDRRDAATAAAGKALKLPKVDLKPTSQPTVSSRSSKQDNASGNTRNHFSTNGSTAGNPSSVDSRLPKSAGTIISENRGNKSSSADAVLRRAAGANASSSNLNPSGTSQSFAEERRQIIERNQKRSAEELLQRANPGNSVNQFPKPDLNVRRQSQSSQNPSSRIISVPQTVPQASESRRRIESSQLQSQMDALQRARQSASENTARQPRQGQSQLNLQPSQGSFRNQGNQPQLPLRSNGQSPGFSGRPESSNRSSSARSNAGSSVPQLRANSGGGKGSPGGGKSNGGGGRKK